MDGFDRGGCPAQVYNSLGSVACLVCAVCDNTMGLGNHHDFAVHVLLYMILVEYNDDFRASNRWQIWNKSMTWKSKKQPGTQLEEKSNRGGF